MTDTGVALTDQAAPSPLPASLALTVDPDRAGRLMHEGTAYFFLHARLWGVAPDPERYVVSS